MSKKPNKNTLPGMLRGFTIVELMVVIVVIAILAAITVVSYTAIKQQSVISALKSQSQQGYKAITSYAEQNNDQYPSSAATVGLANTDTATYSYAYNNSANPKGFCLSVSYQNVTYYTTNNASVPTSGTCPVVSADGSPLQTITSSTCPTIRTRAVDARDSHTYWVQKLADGKCWMLTNLAYAGGGSNTYLDVKTLINGPNGVETYTVPSYYIIPNTTNFTIEPTAPSASTDGGATNSQYGYLYNWCGAMGAPISTDPSSSSACANAATPAPDPSRSVCPAGWRLPTGGAGGEFVALNTALNGGSTTTDAGLLSSWLAQRGAWWWRNGFSGQGNESEYWSSTQKSASNAYDFYFASSFSTPTDSDYKVDGFAIRCVAN